MSDSNSNAGGQGNNQQGGQQKPTLSWSQPAAAKPANVNTKSAAAPATPAKNNTSTSVSAAAESSNMGAYVGIFVAGLVIGALLGWGITSSKGGNTSSTASSTSMTASSTDNGDTAQNSTGTGTGVDLGGSTVGSSGNLTLASTQQAGFAVAVSKIEVTQPTWLVVYEDHAGVPGNAIGAGLFFPGNTSGTIQLLRATLPGQSYFVGQSLDDGDKVFSLTSDKPVRDSTDNPLFTEFTAN